MNYFFKSIFNFQTGVFEPRKNDKKAAIKQTIRDTKNTKWSPFINSITFIPSDPTWVPVNKPCKACEIIEVEITSMVMAKLIIRPIFMVIDLVPAAIPLLSGGTAPIIVLVLGAKNIPVPTPITISQKKVNKILEVGSIRTKPINPIADIINPNVLKPLEP